MKGHSKQGCLASQLHGCQASQLLNSDKDHEIADHDDLVSALLNVDDKMVGIGMVAMRPAGFPDLFAVEPDNLR